MEHAAIFRRLPLAIAVVDRDLKIRDASEAYAALAGVSVDDCLGTALEVGLASDLAGRVAEAVRSGTALDANGVTRPSGEAIRVVVRPLDVESAGSVVVLTRSGDAATDPSILELQDAIRTIRHDINNPLTGALGNINLLLRRQDLDEKTRQRLTTAEQEIKKVSSIVSRLADLAPQGESGSAKP